MSQSMNDAVTAVSFSSVGRQVGHTLVQIVHHRERRAAIPVWGAGGRTD